MKRSRKIMKKKANRKFQILFEKYKRELIILVIQFLFFYFLPLFAGPTDMMGLVVLLLILTFILGVFIGMVSIDKTKFAYPFIVGIMFIPSILFYYNSSALIHAIWYFVVSDVGLLIGMIIRHAVLIYQQNHPKKRKRRAR